MTARLAPRRQRAGMTLIEVMAAMAILAIIVSLLYSAFDQTSHNKQRVEGQLDRYHEITSGLTRMAQEMSMAYVSVQRNPNDALKTMVTAFVAKEQGAGSRIDLTTFSHRRLYRNAHESDQNELSFFLAPDPDDNSRKVLARREQRRIDNDPQKGGQTQILIENVKEFKLSFFDPLTSDWVTTWDTTQAAMQPNRLPMQAKILITVPNAMGHGPDQTFGTRTFFPATYALNFALYKL